MPGLEFTNLPLVEVAVHLTPRFPIITTVANVISVYQFLRDDFPTVIDPQAYDDSPGNAPMVVHNVAGVNSTIFGNYESALFLTLQSNVLSLRWVRLPDGPKYPRYSELRRILERVLASFPKIEGDEPEPFQLARMTYQNLIPSGGNTDLDYLRRYVRSEWLPGIDGTAFVVDYSTAVLRNELPERRVTLKTASTVDDWVGWQLISVAAQRVGDSTINAVDNLHEDLQAFFLELITNQAKAEWGLIV